MEIYTNSKADPHSGNPPRGLEPNANCLDINFLLQHEIVQTVTHTSLGKGQNYPDSATDTQIMRLF